MDIRGWLSSDYEMSNGDNVPGAHDVYVGINARGTVTNFNGKYSGSRYKTICGKVQMSMVLLMVSFGLQLFLVLGRIKKIQLSTVVYVG